MRELSIPVSVGAIRRYCRASQVFNCTGGHGIATTDVDSTNVQIDQQPAQLS
ncbi:hypothetical protein [Secundilactobacillus similis]|uniref:hypothetical protein n=1 Tax=Secundilactobacillus similis TaxID=414682 RepID=UPI0012E2E058|nr:hypothetical protein [Secundilactobacillus similis]